ncbi:unnamed protein product [Prorocentrum cordatum]|uniref:Uncharacterized protein n=1 Tax=Prorocentrum cordatum TaxID=2364126 RepID=A0ABN9V0J4_9DINO|nr:unnamed protein product [Polarella glacialis]
MLGARGHDDGLAQEVQPLAVGSPRRPRHLRHGHDPSRGAGLRRLIQGSAIESCAHFERPDVVEWVVKRMSDVLRDILHDRCATTGGSMIAFCGSPAVGLQVSPGVQEANMFASVLRMAGCRMAFQEEYYGVVGGKPKALVRRRSL